MNGGFGNAGLITAAFIAASLFIGGALGVSFYYLARVIF